MPFDTDDDDDDDDDVDDDDGVDTLVNNDDDSDDDFAFKYGSKGWGFDSEQSEAESGDEPLTQAQIEAYERMQGAIWPTEFWRMDLDGNCYDHDGHEVMFEFPSGSENEDDDDEDYVDEGVS